MVMSFDPEWRENAIEALINDDLNIIRSDTEWIISSILEAGFKGYAHYTDDELRQEMQERDISDVFGENDD